MQIRWTRAAANDLEQIGRYLKEHQPTFAQSTVRKSALLSTSTVSP